MKNMLMLEEENKRLQKSINIVKEALQKISPPMLGYEHPVWREDYENIKKLLTKIN